MEDAFVAGVLAEFVSNDVGGNAAQPFAEVTGWIVFIPLPVSDEECFLGDVVDPIGHDAE